MPTLSPLAIGRPAWTSTAEQRLWSLLHSGHPAPVDTLVAELADTLHITVEQARKEVEHHLDLTGLINQGPAGASTPLVRTVGQTPKASLLAWGSPPESPKTPKAVFAPNNQEVPDRPPREPRRRARTEGYMKVSFSPGENGESPQELRVEVTHSDRITVAVIAPGAGTGINGAIYSELGRNPSFKVEVVGRSRAQYDVYPPCWPHGAAPPNLQTFAEEVLETRVHERVRCMVFGSRSGQVVLPQMWQAQAQGVAQAVPPVVVINGGCAMKLPTPKIWPDKQAGAFCSHRWQGQLQGTFEHRGLYHGDQEPRACCQQDDCDPVCEGDDPHATATLVPRIVGSHAEEHRSLEGRLQDSFGDLSQDPFLFAEGWLERDSAVYHGSQHVGRNHLQPT